MHLDCLSTHCSTPPPILMATKSSNNKPASMTDDRDNCTCEGKKQNHRRPSGEKKKKYELQQQQQQQQRLDNSFSDTPDPPSASSASSPMLPSKNTRTSADEVDDVDQGADDADTEKDSDENELVRELLSEEGKATIAPSDVGTAEYSETDVLTGRGGRTNNLPGNQYFRTLIRKYSNAYTTLENKLKPTVTRKILELVRGRGGRFLRFDKDTKLYYEIGDASAREKISQSLRSITFQQRREAKVVEARRRRNNQEPTTTGAQPDATDANSNSSNNTHAENYFQEEEPIRERIDEEQPPPSHRMPAPHPYPVDHGLPEAAPSEDRHPLFTTALAHPPPYSQLEPPMCDGSMRDVNKLMQRAVHLRKLAASYESMADALMYKRDYGQRPNLPPPQQYQSNAALSNNTGLPPQEYQYYGHQQQYYHAASYGFTTTAQTTPAYYATSHSGHSSGAAHFCPAVHATSTTPTASFLQNTRDVAQFPLPAAPNATTELQHGHIACSNGQNDQSPERKSAAVSTQHSEATSRTYRNTAHPRTQQPQSSSHHGRENDITGGQVEPSIEMGFPRNSAGSSYPALPQYYHNLDPIPHLRIPPRSNEASSAMQPSSHSMEQSFVVGPRSGAEYEMEMSAQKSKARSTRKG